MGANKREDLYAAWYKRFEGGREAFSRYPRREGDRVAVISKVSSVVIWMYE